MFLFSVFFGHASSYALVEKRNKSWTMSSVALLTPESFAEHRSGLKDQEITGNAHLSSAYSRSIPSCFRLPCLFMVVALGQAVSRRMRLTSRPTSKPSLRCQRREHRGRRPGSRHQRGEARSGQSKHLSSPRFGKQRQDYTHKYRCRKK